MYQPSRRPLQAPASYYATEEGNFSLESASDFELLRKRARELVWQMDISELNAVGKRGEGLLARIWDKFYQMPPVRRFLTQALLEQCYAVTK